METGTKCRKCGEEISGGYYNTPDGIYCTECWEKETKEKKQELLRTALEKRSKAIKTRRIKEKEIETKDNKSVARVLRCIDFCKKIASMEKGRAPSVGYMQELITEAENALKM